MFPDHCYRFLLISWVTMAIQEVSSTCTCTMFVHIFVVIVGCAHSLLQLLHEAGVMATYVYSSLDQTARKINVAKFVNKKVMVMVVTDVAVSCMHKYMPFSKSIMVFFFF